MLRGGGLNLISGSTQATRLRAAPQEPLLYSPRNRLTFDDSSDTHGRSSLERHLHKTRINAQHFVKELPAGNPHLVSLVQDLPTNQAGGKQRRIRLVAPGVAELRSPEGVKMSRGPSRVAPDTETGGLVARVDEQTTTCRQTDVVGPIRHADRRLQPVDESETGSPSGNSADLFYHSASESDG